MGNSYQIRFILSFPNGIYDVIRKTPKIKGKWSVQRVKKWVGRIKNGFPLIGCNYISSGNCNSIDFWNFETFDIENIRIELTVAKMTGFRLFRVYLHNQVYKDNRDKFIECIQTFLDLLEEMDLYCMLVFFDDCWSPFYKGGNQPKPIRGKHNSRWVQSPGSIFSSGFQDLENYVTGVVSKFKDNKRIFCWDVYNEPGNSVYYLSSLNLLKKSFEWIRKVNPSQPITSGIWTYKDQILPYYIFGMHKMNDFQIKNSDIISFHSYAKLEGTITHVNYCRSKMLEIENSLERPIICSEYLARTKRCLFETHLPYFVDSGIVPINWGLITGKTNTKYGWETVCCGDCSCGCFSGKKRYKDPKIWFHDVFKENGEPYNVKETELIKKMSEKKEIVNFVEE